MHVKFKGQGLVLCVGNQIILQEIVKNVTETQKKSPDLTCLLTILAGGDGAVLAVGVNLGECEEHHGPGVAAAGERGLSEAAHGHRRSLEAGGEMTELGRQTQDTPGQSCSLGPLDLTG